MNFSQTLKKIRMDKGMEKKEFAKLTGLSYAIYHLVETDAPSYRANSVKRVMNSIFYSKDDWETLQAVYEKKKAKDIVWLKESRKQRYKKMRKSWDANQRDVYPVNKTISEIPDFYEKLNALGNLEELPKDNPQLINLQKELGVRR